MSCLFEIPLLSEKLLSTAALLLITLLSCYLPHLVRLRFKKNSSVIMSYLNCLAGGVVLGALLMHMIPEMMESGHSHGHECRSAHGTECVEYGYSHSASAGQGQAAVLLYAGNAGMHGGDKDGAHVPKKEHGHRDGKKGSAMLHIHDYPFGPLCAGLAFLLLLALDRLFLTHSHCDSKETSPKDDLLMMTETTNIERPKLTSLEFDHHYHNHSAESSLTDDHGSCHSADIMGGCHMDGINNSSSQTQALVFVVALSVHSFMEGLGMATKTDLTGLVSFIISLFGHKWLEAFALGVAVMKARFSTRNSTILLVIYSILTPAGILAGMFLERLHVIHGNSCIQALTVQGLNGMAAGSFLFVSCLEMIPPEFHKPDHAYRKFIALLSGFGLMAIISAFHTH